MYETWDLVPPNDQKENNSKKLQDIYRYADMDKYELFKDILIFPKLKYFMLKSNEVYFTRNILKFILSHNSPNYEGKLLYFNT